MKNKLFVGGIPFASSEQDLQNLFSPYGEVVSAKIVMDKFTGKSRGFGFVEFAAEDAAAAAISALDQTEFMGRTIAVTEAQPPRNNR